MILKKISGFLLDIVEVVVFAIAIFLFIYLLVLQPHKIKGASMEPNFPDGQYILTDKVTYRIRDPQRGDIIVFEAPIGNGEEFIKRIVGEPGERISIVDNTVLINGAPLPESYIPPGTPTPIGNFLSIGEAKTIPSENYFVLGDNRPFSSDSRAWGFVPEDNITGRAWLIYWPISDIGIIEKVTYPL